MGLDDRRFELQPDPRLEAMFVAFQQIPARPSEDVSRGKVQFLEQVDAYAAGLPGVGDSQNWFERLQAWFFRLGRSSFSPALATLAVVLLVLAGGGLAVYAARAAAPDQSLYGLKLWSEQAWLALDSATEGKIAHDLDFADLRLGEIESFFARENWLPEQAIANYQERLDQALDLAAGLSDERLEPVLGQLKTRMQSQVRLLADLELSAPAQARPRLAVVRLFVQTRLEWTEAGQRDPRLFREYVRNHRGETENGAVSGANGAGVQLTPRPTQDNGLNPVSGTPGNSFSAGSGRPVLSTTTPAGNSNRNGSGSGASVTPAPGGESGKGASASRTPGAGQGNGSAAQSATGEPSSQGTNAGNQDSDEGQSRGNEAGGSDESSGGESSNGDHGEGGGGRSP